MSIIRIIVCLALVLSAAILNAAQPAKGKNSTFIGVFHEDNKGEPVVTTHSENGFPLDLILTIPKDLQVRALALRNQVVQVEVTNLKETSQTTATAKLAKMVLADSIKP